MDFQADISFDIIRIPLIKKIEDSLFKLEGFAIEALDCIPNGKPVEFDPYTLLDGKLTFSTSEDQTIENVENLLSTEVGVCDLIGWYFTSLDFAGENIVRNNLKEYVQDNNYKTVFGYLDILTKTEDKRTT